MSTQTSDNNKRIAKNTMMLYIRMLFSMLVTLYTSRVVLEKLGVSDFGTYNVVGGICTLFTFLNGTLSSSTHRFLIYEIGKRNVEKLKKVFSTSLFNHILIALCIFILCETIGIWLLENKLVIEPDRMNAARVVFQFSIITCVLVILNTPFNAAIISHEKMSFFAYISVVEVVLRLAVVYLLCFSIWDNLMLYSLLLLTVQLIVNICYYSYAKKHFVEARLSIKKDKSIQREMLSFASWGLVGNLSAIMSNQGFNILINMFFGPGVNAARGIALQAQNAVTRFGSNFQMALNPQIIKSYAVGDLEYMRSLMYKSINYTFYLLFILSLPIYLEIEYLLTLWLGKYPEMSDVFFRYMLICTIIESLANPFPRVAEASGNIKKYQIIVGGLVLMNIPTSYILLKMGLPVETAFLTMVLYALAAFIARYILVKDLAKLNLKEFCSKVIYKNALVVLLSTIIPLYFRLSMDDTFIRLVLVASSSLVSCCITFWFIGFSKNEKKFVMGYINKIIKKYGYNRK